MHAPEDARVEPRLQLVERPVVRRADVLVRDDRDALVRQRRVDDVLGLHEQEALADLDRQPLAPALPFGDELDDLLQLLVADARARPRGVTASASIDGNAAPRALQRDLEPRRVDRLQQVVDRVDLERLDRVLIVGRDENDMGRRAGVEHPARHLESGQPGHLDVQKHQIRLQPVDRFQRFDPVARLADDFDAADLAEQIAQLIPRQLLVVDDDRLQIHDPALRRHPFRHGELRNLHAGAGAASWLARQLQLVAGAVNRAQPLVDVAESDAAVEARAPAALRSSRDHRRAPR